MKKLLVLILFFSLLGISLAHSTENDTIFVFETDTVLSCDNDSLYLDAGDDWVTYQWNTGATDQGIWVFGTDSYSVFVTDGAGGNDADSVYVNLINASIYVEDNMICFGDTLRLSVERKRSPCLLAYYPFNGDSKDYSGNGYNAFSWGASLTFDRYGNPKSAYSFNGQTSYMFATIDELTPSMSISLWFRLPDTNYWYETNSYPTFFDYGNGQFRGLMQGKNSHFINNNDVGKIEVSHYKEDVPSEDFSIVTLSKPAFEEWHHMYASIDSVSGKHEIWIDGAKQIEVEVEAYLDPFKPLINFGRSDSINQDSSYFIGRLDEISIYKCALDSAEIMSVYQTGSVYKYSYEWSTGDTVSSITEKPLTDTVYYVTVSDSLNSCMDSIKIYVNPEIKLTLDQIDIGCPDSDKAKMLATVEGGTEPYEINWDARIQFIQGDTLALGLKDEIEYSILVNDHVLCDIFETFEVETLDLPDVDFNYTPEEVYIQNPVVNFFSESDSAQTFFWTFGDETTSTERDPSHVYQVVDSYDATLLVTAVNGCVDSITQTIDVKEVELVIPNVFTPNGDGINDTFVILELDKYISNTLVIYNRWGKTVYDKNNYISGDWDGDNVGDGTFFFVLECKGFFSDDVFRGSLNIFFGSK